MTVDEILEQDGKLFKLRKNPFYKKPYKNYDENEPLSKLRRNVKNKKLNAKPTKKELKKSTFDENKPLSKLRRRDVKTKKVKKELRKLTVDEILKQDGKVFTLRKNPFYKKPYKNYDENEPLSKLRRNVKNKKLNAKPTKKELKKSTFDENEPLSKLRRRDVKTKKVKKEFRKLTVDEILKQDGKLFTLRKNPFYKEPFKNYDENEPLSKLRRNVKNKKLNAKPTKKELKKSTFDKNEPL